MVNFVLNRVFKGPSVHGYFSVVKLDLHFKAGLMLFGEYDFASLHDTQMLHDYPHFLGGLIIGRKRMVFICRVDVLLDYELELFLRINSVEVGLNE